MSCLLAEDEGVLASLAIDAIVSAAQWRIVFVNSAGGRMLSVSPRWKQMRLEGCKNNCGKLRRWVKSLR